MKLYNILFEEINPTTPDFGLYSYVDGGYTWLGLIHIPSLTQFLSLNIQTPQINDIYRFCAAMIACNENAEGCLGAVQISYVASSPNWKGAGITMFALASSYFDSPITSDRSHSDSVAARKTWAKIETNPEWKMAGTELDNYAPTSPNKTYMDFQGTYPNRTANVLPGPKTNVEIDDCPLPTKQGELSNAQDMAEVLGTANAYRYNGPLSAQPLINNMDKIMPDLQKTTKVNVPKLISESLVKLFVTRYHTS